MKCSVTISRDSSGEVHIRIRDDASNIKFADVAMSVEAFGYAITGLAEQDGTLEVRGLEFVGKTRVHEKRSIECPLQTYDRNDLSAWLNENAKEEGWILNTYLGSQKSISRSGRKTILNYSVDKYV